MSDSILKKLYAVLLARKNASGEKSYVASLYQKGTVRIVQKVHEEAVETGIEAFNNDPEKLKHESADLIFHLMVLWAHMGVTPEDVMAVLEKRFGTGGHEEKASRSK